MIYVKFSSPDVSLNLAAEYYFAAEKLLSEEVFMLWHPAPTLVVGNFQNIHEEVDVEYAASRGIDIVRRLSGGGTVYQDEGSVQYAFIGGCDKEIDFDNYTSPICKILMELGIPAVRSGRNDITVCGKKVSGNSQYRVAGRTVHHGTLLFSADLDEMERATTLPDYKITSKSIKSVRSRVINMNSFTDKVKTPEEFMGFLASRIAGDNIYVMTDADFKRCEEIAAEKFREERNGNVSSRSPAFDFEKTCRFDGGSVILSFKVKKGIIESAFVRGDFFATEETEALTGALCGISFEKDEIKRAITESRFSAYGISTEELAEKFSSEI